MLTSCTHYDLHDFFKLIAIVIDFQHDVILKTWVQTGLFEKEMRFSNVVDWILYLMSLLFVLNFDVQFKTEGCTDANTVRYIYKIDLY